MQQVVWVRRKKKTKKIKNTPPKKHHDIYISPVTATNSRRRVTKHLSRASPYSPGSVNLVFVEIGLVQLSQSVNTTNIAHTRTHTDRLVRLWHPLRTPV